MLAGSNAADGSAPANLSTSSLFQNFLTTYWPLTTDQVATVERLYPACKSMRPVLEWVPLTMLQPLSVIVTPVAFLCIKMPSSHAALLGRHRRSQSAKEAGDIFLGFFVSLLFNPRTSVIIG